MSKLEMLTDLNALNKYELWNGDSGEKLFFGWEQDSGCFIRNCYKMNREFNMNFENENRQGLVEFCKRLQNPTNSNC